MKYLFWLAISLSMLVTGLAHAETPQLGTCLDKANTWCVQPSTAVGWQLNLKTWGMKNAAVLVGYSLVHKEGFRVGFGLLGGMGLSADNQNAPQLNLLVSLAEYGAVGCGAQRLENGAWQGICGLYAKLETR